MAIDSFDVAIANHSLHHNIELDLFLLCQNRTDNEGAFIVNDMIGRNGHMRCARAMDVIPVALEIPGASSHKLVIS